MRGNNFVLTHVKLFPHRYLNVVTSSALVGCFQLHWLSLDNQFGQ